MGESMQVNLWGKPILRKAPAMGLVGFLLSCASLPYAQRSEVEIQPGSVESESVVVGITQSYELGYHYLRSVVNSKESTVSHVLLVATRVTDPDQVIATAEGPEDTPLSHSPLETKWAGCPQGFCSWTLEWEIELPDKLLRKNLDGYPVKALTTRQTDVEFRVTSGQIWRQLVAVDSIMVWGMPNRRR